MIVFIPGNFNKLHIGHLRLFEFCVQKNQQIIIGLFDDGETGVDEPYASRKANLLSIGSIKKIVKLSNKNYHDTLKKINPDFLLKGSDRLISNTEKIFLKNSSCKVIFNSGNQFIAKKPKRNDIFNMQSNFLKRHKINIKHIISKITNSNKSVAVFGDFIIDEYITCNTNGVSKEDDHTIYSIIDNKIIFGGAFLVVKLLAEISKNVFYFNPLEKNLHSDIQKYNLYKNIYLLNSDINNHVLKKRFIDIKGQVVFRLTDFNSSSDMKYYDNEIINSFIDKIDDIDYVIFSDFNYGAISDNIIFKIKEICYKENIPIFADSQTSSQLGDLKKYNNICLVTPTEHEARMCLQSNDGLALLANNLSKELSCRYLIITLGEFGIFIVDNTSKITIDIFPSLNIKPKYISGAGDTLLAYISFGIANNLNIWEASYLASVAVSHKLNTIKTNIYSSVLRHLKHHQ